MGHEGKMGSGMGDSTATANRLEAAYKAWENEQRRGRDIIQHLMYRQSLKMDDPLGTLQPWLATLTSEHALRAREAKEQGFPPLKPTQAACAEEVAGVVNRFVSAMSKDLATALFTVFCTGLRAEAAEDPSTMDRSEHLTRTHLLACDSLRRLLRMANRMHQVYFDRVQVQVPHLTPLPPIKIREQTANGAGLFLGDLTTDGVWEPKVADDSGLLKARAPGPMPDGSEGRVYFVESVVPFILLWPMEDGSTMDIPSTPRTD